MIVDTSALLALLFAEPDGDWVVARLAEHDGQLWMSTVNLAETLIVLRDRQPQLAAKLVAQVRATGVRFIAPDEVQASIAASARHRYPLNLGDCFAYALASTQGGPILTLDSDFRAVDVDVLLPG